MLKMFLRSFVFSDTDFDFVLIRIKNIKRKKPEMIINSRGCKTIADLHELINGTAESRKYVLNWALSCKNRNGSDSAISGNQDWSVRLTHFFQIIGDFKTKVFTIPMSELFFVLTDQMNVLKAEGHFYHFLIFKWQSGIYYSKD